MSEEQNSNEPNELTEKEWQEKIAKEKEEKQSSPEIIVEEPDQVKSIEQPIIDKDVNNNESPNMDSEKATPANYHLPLCNTNPVETAKQVSDVLSDKKITHKKRREILSDRDHYISRLLQTDDTPASNMQAAFASEAMAETKDPSALRVSDKDKTSHGKKSYNAELSGEAARMAFTSRIKGIKKVYLYNSGFYVCLRPLELTELDDFYVEVDQEGEELGRIIGGLMFMIHDMHLKAKFMDLLNAAVVNSNLIGWNKKKTLIDNVSIQDLDTLYWAVCSMMHRNGIKIDLVCGHEDCQHVSKSKLMDINRMRIVDTSEMAEDALKFLISDEPVKPEQLKEYRNDTLDMSSSFSHNHIKYDLKVPTIGEVLSYQKSLMAEIVVNGNEDHSASSVQTTRRIMLNYNRNFTPWISRVSYLDDEGSVEFSCRDVKGVHAALALNDDSEDEGIIMKEVTNYIKRTKLSHVGYAVIACEKCGKSSTDHINGYKAWDAQALFTSLTYLKLGQIGMA